MAAAKKPYWCLNAVLHDKKRYTTGSKIELTDAEAEPLLKSHAVTKHDPAKKSDPAEKPAKQGQASSGESQ